MSRHHKNTINGWINLYKPLHITSTSAVGKVKWLLKPQKIGHAGTLDPLATGVLPLALGEGTKCVNLLMDAKKTYEFTVTFGERRSTEDAEGEIIATSDIRPTESQIRAILPQFTGPITQLPPIYSALKIDGQRAYDLARAGEEVVLQPRPVIIHALEYLSPLRGEIERGAYVAPSVALSPHPNPPPEGEGINQASFCAVVSKGTYIRSLGRDIAQALGTEGYISRLHRAAVGPFTDQNAISLDFLEESVHKAPQLTGDFPWLTPLYAVLDDIPALALNGGQVNTLRHGQRVTLENHHPDTPLVAVLESGELKALAKVEGNQVITIRLLNV